MRIAWLSDIHLNHVDEAKTASFLEQIASTDADAFVISGDTGVASNVWNHLLATHEAVQVPVYFVLGNHDFYGSSIKSLSREIADQAESALGIVYLSDAGVQALTENTCLIGHDSWADGRLGNFAESDVELNDYIFVEEVTGLTPWTLQPRLAKLGDQAAAYIEESLSLAVGRFAEIVVVTHVPPFREACRHRGQICDDNYLPHFGCKAVGDVLHRIAAAHPESNLTVLCGHTHGTGVAQILDNLTVFTAGARYGKPHIQRILELP